MLLVGVNFVKFYFYDFFLFVFGVFHLSNSTYVVNFPQGLFLFIQIVNIFLPCITNFLDLSINLINFIMKLMLTRLRNKFGLLWKLWNNGFKCHLYTLFLSALATVILSSFASTFVGSIATMSYLVFVL